MVFLKQGRQYEAANEFEWARKLMPGHPDPRVNLAMTLEKAGKVEDALASYGAALEVYAGYLPAVQGMARLTVKADGRTSGSPGGWRPSHCRARRPIGRSGPAHSGPETETR